MGTKKVERAAVLEERQRNVDLEAIRSYNSGRRWRVFYTLGLVYTESPTSANTISASTECSVTTAHHPDALADRKGGGFHYHEAEQRSQSLPVAVLRAPARTDTFRRGSAAGRRRRVVSCIDACRKSWTSSRSKCGSQNGNEVVVPLVSEAELRWSETFRRSSGGLRARSAIITATIRWHDFPVFHAMQYSTAGMRSIPRRWWANRGRKISLSRLSARALIAMFRW